MTAEIVEADGIAMVPPMPRLQAWDAWEFLSGQPQHPGHVVASPADGVTCWAMEDVLRAPHLFEFALTLTDIAGAYLGRSPVLYSLHAFTTYPANGPAIDYIQEFHRDKDDTRFVTLFVYLTDVFSKADGAHQFQIGTHAGAETGHVYTVLGPAGTAFLADTSGLHRGLRPRTAPRAIAWARWGVSPHPIAYDWDRLSPVTKDVLGTRYPKNPALQDAIRLVVQ